MREMLDPPEGSVESVSDSLRGGLCVHLGDYPQPVLPEEGTSSDHIEPTELLNIPDRLYQHSGLTAQCLHRTSPLLFRGDNQIVAVMLLG